MTKQLPDVPSLEFLRKEAKDVHRAHHDGDVSACTTLRHHPGFTSKSYDELLGTTVSLQQIQHALALEYGFANWTELCSRVERTNQAPSPDRTFSVEPGDTSPEGHLELVEIGPGNWVYKDKHKDRLFYCPQCLQGGVPVMVLQANVTEHEDGGDTLAVNCPRCANVWRGDNPCEMGFGTPLVQ